jgi:predicted enzyme related to lactoylglutathione lyase
MTVAASTPLSFTKLVVDDLDAMADYYCEVFGLHRGFHESFDDGVGGEPIEEIALAARPEERWGSLILLKFLDRPPAKDDESILGFTTTDLTALVGRIERAGGTLVGAIKARPELGIRVAFARDPEGHLLELVETRS